MIDDKLLLWLLLVGIFALGIPWVIYDSSRNDDLD